MDEEKKPEPLTGQRRVESQYAKYEGKFLMVFVFLTMGSVALIGFVFMEIYIPAKQKKEQQARADLEVLAQAANVYRHERGGFPESIEELMTFSHARRAEGENALLLKDPWKQRYYYFKVSDTQAVCASSGRNRRLDLDLKDLSPPSENAEHCIRARGGEIFSYYGNCDDWVILAGSWPSSEQMGKEHMIGIVGGVGPYAGLDLAIDDTVVGETPLIDPTLVLARALVKAVAPDKLRAYE